MIKKQRNKPCWCGSGIKYKKCHLQREQELKVPAYKIHNDFKNSLKHKECKVPNELKHKCSNKIIKAHTISKSANLKSIARDGKVYGMNFNMLDIEGDSNPVQLELIHINQASIFYIFCSIHDKVLFAPLEDAEFIFSQEQIFLLSYRTVAKAMYMKEQQVKLFSENVSTYDKGFTNKFQHSYIQAISHMFSDEESQLSDIRRIKKTFDNDLLVSRYDNMKYYCILIDKVPEVMVSGILNPDRDFDGNILVDYVNDPTKEYNAIVTSIIKIEDNGAIIFSWNSSIESHECDIFIQSLHNLNNEDKINAITCLLLKKNKENLYFSPSWYEGLDSNKKKLIDESYVADEYINHTDEEVEELLNSDMTLLPSYFKNLDRSSQKKLLNSIPIKDDDISDFEEYDLFNWKILDIKIEA
ncbi:MAG: Unknown protein [uncultured Sulfurovum sp.]|uniref:Uncharacterized protein n=1 Tax=uncultured Sulfurovum sp. TaxID=269237 RepID=A0A6S6T7Q3_9BACT|nr:MAG: Unknown protein [uncultured Sulfurovum sp.]